MGSDIRALVSDYIHAVGDGRLDELSAYLQPDVTFESPGLPSHQGIDAYIDSLRRIAPIISRNEIKRVLVSRDEACVQYDFVTDSPVGAVASVEWLTIEDGRIAAVYLLFDKERWPEVLEHLAGV